MIPKKINKDIDREIKKDIIQLADGFWYYWPSRRSAAYEAHTLREIADELDRRNAPIQISVDEYFAKKGGK